MYIPYLGDIWSLWVLQAVYNERCAGLGTRPGGLNWSLAFDSGPWLDALG